MDTQNINWEALGVFAFFFVLVTVLGFVAFALAAGRQIRHRCEGRGEPR